jgi:hypothetical protein
MSSFMSFKHTSRSELIILVVKCRNVGWKDLYDLLERGEMHADFSGVTLREETTWESLENVGE